MLWEASTAISLAICLITALFAVRKGYNFFAWLFPWGILGLIVLAFLPFANEPVLSYHVARRRRWIGNSIGLGLTGSLLIVALVAFVVRRMS
jgi:hypothetical protein